MSELGLLETCPHCGGTKTDPAADPRAAPKPDCPRCSGLGVLGTAAGRELVEFLKAYETGRLRRSEDG